MEFEWSEAKRLSNLDKHGLDFNDADILSVGDHLLEEARSVGDEIREKAIGLIDGRPVALIFTRRGAVIRVISLRRARNDERRRHQALYG
jgi:uncharacterized DUF497 family protein